MVSKWSICKFLVELRANYYWFSPHGCLAIISDALRTRAFAWSSSLQIVEKKLSSAYVQADLPSWLFQLKTSFESTTYVLAILSLVFSLFSEVAFSPCSIVIYFNNYQIISTLPSAAWMSRVVLICSDDQIITENQSTCSGKTMIRYTFSELLSSA